MRLKNIIILLSIFILTLIFVNLQGEDQNIDDNLPLLASIDTNAIHILKLTRLTENYSGFLSNELKNQNNVGAAVAVVHDDTVILMQPFGVRKYGESKLVNINTRFRLASVSKGFAGVLGCLLHNNKILNLDLPVKEVLPGFRLKDTVNTDSLTLRHTLNHTTGLVPHAYDNLVEADIPMSEIIARLVEVDIAAAPGKVYGYQNAVFSMIDTVLKVKTGSSYQQMLDKLIFKPLQMNRASVDFESMQQDSDIAYPHVRVKGGYSAVKLNERYYNVAPAAGVNASISDLSKWLLALLGNNSEVLNDSVLNLITNPSIQTPLRRRYTHAWGTVDDKWYSYGWRIYSFRGRKIIYHGGYVRGYRAEIAFCPEEKTGAVFVQNSPNRVSAISMPTFWNMYFDLFDN